MSRRTKLAILISSLLGTHSPAVLATDRLGMITITATPFATEAEDAPSSVDVLGGDEKRQAESLSLGATLDDIPGVATIATGGQIGNPVIRGLSGNRIRVLNDGVAQDYQQYGVRHPANVDPLLADRIEVVRGPMSVLYGSDALGGVVNMISPELPVAPGGSDVSGRLTSGFASNNDEKLLGGEIRAAKGGFGLAITGNWRDAGDMETPSASSFAETGQAGDPKFTGRLDHTDYENRNGRIAFGYTGEQGEVEVSYTDWRSQQNFLLPDGNPVGQNLENRDWAIRGEYALAGDWLLKSRIHWQENVRQALTGGDYDALDAQGPDLDIRRDRRTVRLGVEHPEWAGWRGEVGVERADVDQDLRSGGLTPDAEREEWAIYAFEQRDMGPVTLQLGARVDQITQSAERSAAFDSIDTRERDYTVATGSAGLAWAIDDRWTVKANLGRGFRAPSIFELFADGVHGGVAAVQQGDPSLTEETSLNADLGVTWQGEQVEWSATVYQNRINDYIYLANTGTTQGPLPVYAARQDDAKLQGIELAGQWQFARHWTLDGGFDAVRGELDDGGDLPLMPADSLRAGLAFDHGGGETFRDWHVRLGVSHHFEKDAAGPYEPFAQFDNNSFGTASTDDYTLVSLGAGVSVPFQRKTELRLTLQVDNLLDETYRDFLDTYKGYALGMGRNVRLRADLAF
ncbi:TonB-dependent receptor [Guyparkeria halophila]|uniref:TonB-dependent receptor n=1 Tax=Guyparkeria halophila TaxID=47960 RepID=A0ABZ0YXY1_9GAMM|nr:TonB-dependent receptor [Guyparkeria halophila]WQH16608.1 TonB-dependent receptor [Guyparkeria halophila]